MPFFKGKQTDSLPLQQLKENLQINFEPVNAKPVTYYKTLQIQRVLSEHFFRFGYVSDFMQTGEPAIFVHGTPGGRLQIPDFKHNKDFVLLSPKEFYHHLVINHAIDLSKDKRTLHLVSCYSGAAKDDAEGISVAQELANVLQRKIWAYGGYEKLYCDKKHKGLIGMINNKGDVSIRVKNKYKKAQPKLVTPHFYYS